MVHRLSVASRDRGAGSSMYGDAPLDRAGYSSLGFTARRDTRNLTVATRPNMSVVDHQNGRWYVKGIGAPAQPMELGDLTQVDARQHRACLMSAKEDAGCRTSR
jgi:hypothetical protein